MRPPDKTRYLNALRHVECAEVPFFEQEIETTVAAKILGRPLPPVRPFEIPARDYVELNLRAGNDMIFWAHVWELGRKNVVDAEGRKHYVDGTMKTRADFARIEFPDLGEIRSRLEELLAAMEGTGLGLEYTPPQAPFIVMTAIGYQDYYERLITDPAFIHEFQERVHPYCMRELEMALEHPIDAVQVGAVLCGKNGPLTSRAMMEEFEFPTLRERVKAAKAKGRPVSIHQDGNVGSLFPDFIAMGIDAVNPIEPCDDAQDIYALKRAYGDRIALHGNIDLNLLAFGTRDDIAEDVARHIAGLATGGGYVCASSHNITEAIPVENFFAMRDAVHAHRFRPRP
jgi:uroporphyrinogen decarboxylase